MENYNPASAVYLRDSSLPFWQNNVDAESIFEAFSHRPERARTWLRHRNVSETCSGFERAVMMHGHFEGGILQNYIYRWTFTPGRKGDLAIVVPVLEGGGRLVDFVAMSRHDENAIWGCCTGVGRYVGEFSAARVAVHKTPLAWLLSGDGVLPLAKSFFPLLQFANNIVARDGDHAWELANQAFLYPAERLGLDVECAEQAAFDRISFDEATA
jgi:hypothetical protein